MSLEDDLKIQQDLADRKQLAGTVAKFKFGDGTIGGFLDVLLFSREPWLGKHAWPIEYRRERSRVGDPGTRASFYVVPPVFNSA